MRSRRLSDVAAAVGGKLAEDGDAVVRGIAVDSRGVTPGDLFVALPGDRVNGEDFVEDALARGAAAAMVGPRWAGRGGRLIVVDDPGAALLRLAGHQRANLRAHVVGITGSTGKTCTKDLTAAVLRRRFDVVASPASFNNEVGLPLTLLEADEQTEAIVCEMGSRGPGHIRLLCEVARPTIGVVTNVGVAHMELFGSPEVLRDAKAELPESLPADGAAILNADDPVVRDYGDRTPARVVWFGTEETADVAAKAVEVSPGTGLASFVLRTPDGSAPVRLRVPGEHMVPNALAAAAVGWTLGMSAAECADQLATASVSGGRMEVTEAGGVRVLNDAYNANPVSMAAALRAARAMAGDGRCIAVLGYMAELGPIAQDEHRRIGELAARLGIDLLVVVGTEASLIAAGARDAGLPPDRMTTCAGPQEAAALVGSLVRSRDLVLVKASRVARLERVADALERSLADRPRQAAG